ncbi:SpoIIE family protein phosphatase [Streptomyces cadmiisoli]|uniref:SpoIIE family protein phosphatase n=1 Tax=Streptomyces cadmiisoli TaxID=2184053 RepID=UPI0036480C18
MNERLSLLTAVEEGITNAEVLQLALEHAVAELRGLGGAVHVCGPMSAMRLVGSAGLPPALVRSWDIIDRYSLVVPARVIAHGGELWAQHGTRSADELMGGKQLLGTGLAAVAIPSDEDSFGSLTILTGAAGEPTREQWDFLKAVSTWVRERMSQAPAPTGLSLGEPGHKRKRPALGPVEVGAWEWDLRTGSLAWDEAAMAVYGTDPADFVPRVESWMRVVHTDDLAWTLAAVEEAIRTRGAFEAEYRVRRPDGGYVWTQSRGMVMLDGTGEPHRMIGTTWEKSQSRSARDALSRALRHMSDGFLAVDKSWCITFANLRAETMLRTTEEELIGRTLWSLATLRQLPEVESRCRAASQSGPTGLDMCVPNAQACYHLRVVPIPDGFALYFTDVTDERKVEAQRIASERTAVERSSRIAELTAGLAAATTSADVIDAVARRVLPPFGASGLLVQVREGGRAHTLGAVGYPSDIVDSIESRAAGDDPGWEAWVMNEPRFISSPEEYLARFPGLADRIIVTGKQAWAFMPLTASGQTFGVCTISFDEPRHLTDEERTLLVTITALVAHALERARLYDAEHTRSRELQRALLPQTLPDVPSCRLAARYLPTAEGVDVGGDWYDVIPLAAGRVALVIGDVMGHGLSEAVTMGRLRTAIHTLAGLGLAPDEIMNHLNDIVSGLGDDLYVTCLFALYDSSTSICTIARAGHPPPAVVHPDGSVHFPEAVLNPPLGAAQPPIETFDLEIQEGSVLVLFTDGLVESSERGIDQGLSELTELLQGSDTDDLDRLCDRLIAELAPATRPTADDIALLIARPCPMPVERKSFWTLPQDPQAAGIARTYIREQLSSWGLDALIPTTELLASELVGNAIRYAKGPTLLRLLYDTELTCEVSDGSLTTPRIRHAAETDEGGRGLQLVASLSQHWGVRYRHNGKSIWTAQQVTSCADADASAVYQALGDFDLDAVPPIG